MKKKIAILGSTGSIGKTLINILKKDKKNFEIVLLTANKNYNELLKQAKIFNVKNLILTNTDYFLKLKKKKYSNKVNIFNNFNSIDKVFKKKIDYTMSSISGIEGLKPTVKFIKHTNVIAIANKEAIICGWNILKKELKKNKTKFIPVDSEHFSIHYGMKNSSVSNINKIYLNRGPGSFAGIRNSLSVVKAFNLANNIDYYCYSLGDFKGEIDIKYENIPNLCEKFKIEKNLINPIY